MIMQILVKVKWLQILIFANSHVIIFEIIVHDRVFSHNNKMIKNVLILNLCWWLRDYFQGHGL